MDPPRPHMMGDSPALAAMTANQSIMGPPTPLSPSLPVAMTPVMEPIPQLPITPPSSDIGEEDPRSEAFLASAVHVLSTEAAALSCLARLYQTDPSAREGFARAVNAIVASGRAGGKLVVCGVGKSGKIGEKLVATMNSLGVMSVFLHPVEALHGDLGVIRKADAVLLITFSGRTSELSSIMPQLPRATPLIAMTSHAMPSASPVFGRRPDTIFLPTPIHEAEEVSFGVAAPTTSTTVTMALGDALAITVSSSLHAQEGRSARDVFRENHPGGAIGMR
ncbi:MAG: hypothetical protein M1815_001716 [Lichina confinis]|nr:MAG: hypothetical protein M1815_001716 [Lichina confinis]